MTKSEWLNNWSGDSKTDYPFYGHFLIPWTGSYGCLHGGDLYPGRNRRYSRFRPVLPCHVLLCSHSRGTKLKLKLFFELIDYKRSWKSLYTKCSNTTRALTKSRPLAWYERTSYSKFFSHGYPENVEPQAPIKNIQEQNGKGANLFLVI